MIIETLVTTIDAGGNINLAPMGPHLDSSWENAPEQDPVFVLKPFLGSQTQRNLSETKWAVIHFSDDMSLFARTCVGKISPDELSTLTATVDLPLPGFPSHLKRLRKCTRYFVVEVQSVVDDAMRLTMHCATRQSGVVDPPRGLNRASLAVIEAAILATRTHLIDAAEVRGSIDRLRPLVDKTAGDVSRLAFDQVVDSIERRLSEPAT